MRFPGFGGEWGEILLGALGQIVGGGTPDTTKAEFWNGDIQWFTPSEVGKEKYVSQSQRQITKSGLNDSSAKLLPPGSVLLSSRATVGECSLNLMECCTNQGFQSFIPSREFVDGEFLYYLLQTHKRDFLRKACGSTFLEISAKQIGKVLSHIPQLNEQLKISSFLSKIDHRIAIQNKVIEQYESLIRAIILRCQSSPTSQKVYLREILTERKELNERGYVICSVSVSKGIINQVEYLGRSFAAKETAHYHVVHKGDIVYTKSPTGEFPYGIIKQSYLSIPVAVSPLYGVYMPVDYETGVYLHHFFCSTQNTKNYLHKLIQKGAKNTINISNQHFLDNQIRLPKRDDLCAIVAAIEDICAKEESECRMLELFEQQRMFFLSKMFI